MTLPKVGGRHVIPWGLKEQKSNEEWIHSFPAWAKTSSSVLGHWFLCFQIQIETYIIRALDSDTYGLRLIYTTSFVQLVHSRPWDILANVTALANSYNESLRYICINPAGSVPQKNPEQYNAYTMSFRHYDLKDLLEGQEIVHTSLCQMWLLHMSPSAHPLVQQSKEVFLFKPHVTFGEYDHHKIK